MRIIRENGQKCEICYKNASYSIRLARLGIDTRVDICDSCLRRLKQVIGKAIALDEASEN